MSKIRAAYWTFIGAGTGGDQTYTHDYPVDERYIGQLIRAGHLTVAETSVTVTKDARIVRAVLSGDGYPPVEILASH